MKFMHSSLFLIFNIALTLAQVDEWPRRRVELRRDLASDNSCSNNYTSIPQDLYDKLQKATQATLKQYPIPQQRRDLPISVLSARSATFPRGKFKDFITAYRDDGDGYGNSRQYLLDDDPEYKLGGRFRQESSGVAEDMAQQACLWFIKHEWNIVKSQALRSAKRRFKNYIQRIAEHAGDAAIKSMGSAVAMVWNKYARRGAGGSGSKRDNGNGTEDLGFTVNMEVQFRDGKIPFGAPRDPKIVKVLNIVDDNMDLKETHIDGYWPADEYLGRFSHMRPDVSARDDKFDNQCRFPDWASFRTQINLLWGNVAIPMLTTSDDDLHSIEFDLFSSGRRSVYKGVEGGAVRVKFWISEAPTLSDFASYNNRDFETAPDCLNNPADLQNALQLRECYVQTERTIGLPAPYPHKFWYKVSDQCRQAFHGSMDPENHSKAPTDSPKDFHYYDEQNPGNWRVEFLADKCTTPFLCSELFGVNGDGQSGAVGQHQADCKDKAHGGDGAYYGGVVHVTLGTQNPGLRRQTEALGDQDYRPCGVLRIFPKEAGDQAYPR